jgi:tRNA threonylcarbamoyladenosine biosynthesis protein TsaB
VADVMLALDAAAGDGTIAVVRDGALVVERTVQMRSAEEERFFPAVLEALEAAGASPRGLSRIVCGGGPGGFTALRVVAACAKGLAHGADIPLFAVPSLALIVAGAADATAKAGRWFATLDALRGEKYAALVVTDGSGVVVSVEQLGLVPNAEIASRASGLDAVRIGPGESTVAAPHARGVLRCAALVEASGPVALESWEPSYGRLAEAQVKWEAAAGHALRATTSES